MKDQAVLASIALTFMVTACSAGDAQESAPQNTMDDIDESATEKTGTIAQALTADYDAGGIIYTNCTSEFPETKTRGIWATSTCPPGKILAGWSCYWSVNTEQDPEIRAFPNQIQCQYRSKGTNVTAQAYCCNLEVK